MEDFEESHHDDPISEGLDGDHWATTALPEAVALPSQEGAESRSYSSRSGRCASLPHVRRLSRSTLASPVAHSGCASSIISETLRRNSANHSFSSLSELNIAVPSDQPLWTLPRFSMASLMTAWALNVLGALYCMLLSEVYQENAETFSLPFMVTLGSHLNLLSALMVYLIGRHQHGASRYKFYQPFQGGQRFVVLQFFGVFSVSLSLISTVVYTATLHTSEDVYRGVLAINGLLAAFGNVLLFISPRYFEPAAQLSSGQAGSSHSMLTAYISQLTQSPHTETFLVVCIAFGQCFLAVLTSAVPSLRVITSVGNLACQLLNGLLVHWFIGCKTKAGYHFFMCIMQRPVETIIYWGVWLLYIASLAADVWVLGKPPLLSSALVAVAGLNVFSSVALVLFVRTTSFQVAKVSIPPTLQEYGGLAITAASGLTTLFNIVASLYAQREGPRLRGTPEGEYEGYLIYIGLLLSQTFLLMLAPLTHISGRILHGHTFSIFVPSSQYRSFVLIQGCGWLLYLGSILSFALFLSSTILNTYIVASITAQLSTMCIVFSLKDYNLAQTRERTTTTTSHSESGGTLHLAAGDEPITPVAAKRPQLSYVLNGEMIVSYLMACTNVMLRFILDVGAMKKVWGDVNLTQQTFIIITAQLLYCGCVPLAHLSARDKGVAVFRPFSGSTGFVALQVLGWSTYAFWMAVEIASSMISYHHSMRPEEWILGRASSSYINSLKAVLEMIPLVLITVSVTVESHYVLYRNRRKQIAEESFLYMREALMQVVEGIDDEHERRTYQLAFQTIAEPAMQFYEIPYSSRSMRLYTPRSATAEFAGTNTYESDDYDKEDCSLSDSLEDDDKLSHAQVRMRHEGARLITILLSVTSATFYTVGAFFASVTVLSRACAVCGLIVATAGCAGIHGGYGMIVHHSHNYAVFMPFKGGPGFLNNQVAGWGSFACMMLVTLVVTVEPDGVSAVFMVAAAILSVLCQVFILNSIPKFDWRKSRAGPPSFVEENGEGIVAALTFTGACVFGHTYELIISALSSSHPDGASGDIRGGCEADANNCTPPPTAFFGVVSSRRSNVPFILTVLSISLALPCVLMAMDRTTKEWRKVAKNATRRSQKKKVAPMRDVGVAATIIRNLLEVSTMTLASTIPVLMVLALYYIQSNLSVRLLPSVQRIVPALLLFTLSIVVLSIVPHLLKVGAPSFVVTIRCTLLTWVLYGLALVAGVVFFSPVLLFPRLSTYYLALCTVVVTILGAFKPVRLMIRVGVHALIGYRTYQEYVLFSQGSLYAYGNGSVSEIMEIVTTMGIFALDVMVLSFWLWYIPTFSGKPEYTSALRSPKFIELVRHYWFAEVVKYFHFSIIADDPSVQMRDDTTQYIFSFHPHGVFPGTAMICSLTEEWRDKIGVNAKRYLSTHVAGIIFNVPIIRDFNLLLGSLSVSRSALEASLSRGNSVCIVTGGQAEMLRTEVSDTSMTLITRHQGFIRLAIANKVPLVPLISFGENNVMGLLQFPRIQRFTLKLLGFPFPMIPYGAYFLPLPYRTHLTMVVGSAIPIPEGADSNNQDDVDALTDVYFDELKKLFYRHRVAAGYPEMELVLIPRPTKEQREARKKKKTS